MESHIYDIPTSINKDLLIICPPFERFDYTACDSFKEIVDENILKSEYTYVLIDLQNITTIDNEAIGALFYAWRKCCSHNILLVTCNHNPKVLNALNNSGIYNFITMKETYESAIEEIKNEIMAKQSLINKSDGFEQFFGNLYKKNRYIEYSMEEEKHNSSPRNFMLNQINEEKPKVQKTLPKTQTNPANHLKGIFKNALDAQMTINNIDYGNLDRSIFEKDKSLFKNLKNTTTKKARIEQEKKRKYSNPANSTILLIEPDEDLAKKMAANISKLNVQVKYVLNAAEAFRFLSSNHVDIVISELILPNSNGSELCKLVKQKNPHLYFMIITGKTDLCYKLEAFKAGADDYISKLTHVDEILERIRAADKITKIYKTYHSEIQKLERMVITDPLTSLYNRRYFQEQLMKELDRSKRYNKHLAIMVIDIDYFKKINDTYGHLIGDEILKRVSNLLKSSTRQSDIVCRIGGEEFVVLLPETDTEKAFFVAEKIRNVFAKTTFIFTNTKINITISIGIAINENNNNVKAGEFVDMADKALYIAKNEGRNRTIIYHLSKNHSINI